MVSVSSTSTEAVVQEVRPVTRGVEIDISLPDTLLYFQGHFPGRPILPGVVQIDWAVRWADRYLNTKIGSAQNFRVKFKSVIEPEQSLTVVLQRSADNRRLLFEYRDATAVLSSGSIELKDNP